MAAKKNKAKNLSKKKGVDFWPWFNLPEDVIQLLRSKRRRISSLHYIYIAGTIKSWTPATSRCSRTGECRRWPELYLFGKSLNNSSAPTRQKFCSGNYRIQSAAMDSGRIVVYCTDRPWWIRYECTIIDPFDVKKRHINQFTSIIGCQGKFYALSLQGALAVIENIDSRLMITGFSSSRAVPSVSSRFFKEYLVEMNGEIFLVFFIHQKTPEVVDQVEVFRLCFVTLKWIKAERLKGKTLFLDQRCCWVNSAEIGCRGDCIYFTQGLNNGWWIYDMERGCISPASMENKTGLG